MKAMKTFAALLALAFSLAGCGAVYGSPVRPAPGSAGQGSSTAASGADSAEPEQLAAMRQLAGENGDLAGVLYLGSVPERTTDVHAVLDSLPEQPWQFVADIPAGGHYGNGLLQHRTPAGLEPAAFRQYRAAGTAGGCGGLFCRCGTRR